MFTLRLCLRICTIVLNVLIIFLAIFFWRDDLKPIDRTFLAVSDLKYIEFIERVYNGGEKMLAL